ncbi:MAG: Zn-dependent protease [Vicinamibacteria bacterium]|nr:Zn-dependent protease [Vicinamibacteria bacterium]
MAKAGAPADAVFAADVAFARDALAAFYLGEVEIRPVLDLPAEAYYPPRKRYRAEKLLDWLEARRPTNVDRVIGVTTRDISTTKEPYADWGVLGLASLSGTTCVLSTFRCRMAARDALHARIRFGKVIVHEVGHTLGLPHCATVGCLMEDAQGSVRTTDREYDLCPVCRATLTRGDYPLVRNPVIPWPRPA